MLSNILQFKKQINYFRTWDFNYTRLTNSDLISQMTRPNGVTSSWSYECYQFAQGWMNRHLGNNTQ